MYDKDAVKKLIADLGKFATEEGFELGDPYMFGLAYDVYDPVSGQVIAVCRPHRREWGEQEIMRTPEQVAAEVASARAWRKNDDMAHGRPPRLSPKEQAAADTAAKERTKAADAEKARLAKQYQAATNVANTPPYPALAQATPVDGDLPAPNAVPLPSSRNVEGTIIG